MSTPVQGGFSMFDCNYGTPERECNYLIQEVRLTNLSVEKVSLSSLNLGAKDPDTGVESVYTFAFLDSRGVYTRGVLVHSPRTSGDLLTR